MMGKGFNLPVEMNVPIEIEQKESERVAKDIAYNSEKQRRLARAYNNPKGTKLRRVAEFLWLHHQEILHYKEIAEDISISEGSAKGYVASLNFFDGFPMTWIPVPKRKGYIQGSLNNYTDYESWDIKKQRTIGSMEQVKDKAERIAEGKRKPKKEEVIIENGKNRIKTKMSEV